MCVRQQPMRSVLVSLIMTTVPYRFTPSRRACRPTLVKVAPLQSSFTTTFCTRSAPRIAKSAHNIRRVARPPHDNTPDGYKRAGRLKKTSNTNYGLRLSLILGKHLAELQANGSSDEFECLHPGHYHRRMPSAPTVSVQPTRTPGLLSIIPNQQPRRSSQLQRSQQRLTLLKENRRQNRSPKPTGAKTQPVVLQEAIKLPVAKSDKPKSV